MADAIKLLSSMATRVLLADLADRARKDLGVAIELESIAGVGAARKVADGAEVDVVVLAESALLELIRAGWLAPESRKDLVRSSMVAAVRAGVASPDIRSEQGLRGAVASAVRVGYSTGPSGQHLLGLIGRWGLQEEVSGRLVQAPPGVPVGRLIAEGEVDLGFQQLSELMDMDGIAVLGPLPEPVQHITVFSGAVAAKSQHKEQAARLLAYLSLPQHDDLKKSRGMDPA